MCSSDLMNFHAVDTNLVALCDTLERVRPHAAPLLLQALLDQNPSGDVRGHACLALAQIRQAEAGYGVNTNATIQAENLYQRVINEFGNVKYGNQLLADLARPQLDDLRRLSIGMAAPATDGQDFDGHPLSLSSYQGRPVILIFWCKGCAPQVNTILRLVDELKATPFAIVGVYASDDEAEGKQTAQETGMTWPNFFDGRFGPISKTWHDDSWPSLQVIDAHGVIRARNVTDVGLRQALAEMLIQDNPPPQSGQ